MSEGYWKEMAERLEAALRGAMEHAGSLKQRVRDAERRAERAERRRQEIDDEAYEYAEKAGEWQARAERLEAAATDVLSAFEPASVVHIGSSHYKYSAAWPTHIRNPVQRLSDALAPQSEAGEESGDDHE